MINYYKAEYEKAGNSTRIKNIVALADEVLTLYLKGGKERIKSLEKTKDFTKAFVDAVNYGLSKGASYPNDVVAIKSSLENPKGQEGASIVETETQVIKRRLDANEEICEAGLLHNVLYVNWLIKNVLGLEKGKELHEIKMLYTQVFEREKAFLDEDQEKVRVELEKKYSEQLERKFSFIRNAKRVERFSSDPINDMYVPLILSRTANEEYIKYLCVKHFGKLPEWTKEEIENLKDENTKKRASANPQKNLNDLINHLSDNGKITKAYANELHALRLRGNANTHQSMANYKFAVAHCVMMLREFYKDFN